MAAPHTPQVVVEAAFGNSSGDFDKDWVDLATYRPRDVAMSRGRPSELDRFKPGSLSLSLTDTTARDLDPTNLSGPYVETVTTTSFPMYVGTVATEAGTSLGSNNAITNPTGVVVGELLLAYVAVDLNGGATGVSLGTGSAAWTELFDDANGTIVRHACYARIATGSDALVLTGSAEDYVVEIIRVARHGCATTADIEVGTTVASSGAGINPPSLNAGLTAKWLWLALGAVDCTSSTLFTGNVGTGFMVIDQEISAVSTSSVGLTWAYMEDEVSTKDPGTMPTNFSRDWVANTIAIPPETTTRDRTQVVPGTPIRVTGVLDPAVTVLDDPATGPELHSAWRVEEGAITGSISGSYPLPPGLVMTGPAYNWDGESSFQFGTAADGATPNHDVRIVTAQGNYFGWNLTGTTLTYQVHFGGSTADDTATWNDTNHRYLRMRVDGEDLIWERSADASSWTTIDTYTRGSDFTDIDWSYGYLYVSSQGTTTPSLDDFKVQVSRSTRFTGRVDSWDYTPYGGNQGAAVQVRASDRFAELANTTFPQRWQEAVTDLAPAAWYPLGERDSTTAYDASGNHYDGIVPTTLVAQAEPPVTPPLGNGSLRFHHDYPPNFRGVRLPDDLRRTSYPFTVNLWMQSDGAFETNTVSLADGVGVAMLFAQGPAGGTTTHWFYIRVIGGDFYQPDPGVFSGTLLNFKILLERYDDTSAYSRTLYPCAAVDGLPHMVTVVANSLSSWQLYIDGAEQPGVDRAPGDLDSAFDAVAGMWIGPPGHPLDLVVGGGTVQWNTPFWGLEGWIDEVTVHDEALTADDVADLYTAASRVGDGDSTGARVNRVLDLIDWGPGERRVDTGTVTLSPDYLFGESILSYLQKVETTEGGRLFMGPHGEVVFHDANRVVTRGTSPVLFDDAGVGVNILGGGFAVTHDDSFLYTGASVTREGGLEQSYRDADATSRYGVRDWSASLLARTDVEAYARAVGMVEVYKEPRPRVGAWTVAPEKTPADWATVFDVRLGDTAQLQFTLLDTGDTYDEYLDVAAINERISGGAWTIEFMGTPQDPGIGTFLVLDAASGDNGLDFGRLR